MIKLYTSLIIGVVSIFLISLIPSCKKKIKLEDTVVSVKEIKEIGHLITAEYYGEVLSSLSIIESNRIDSAIVKGVELLSVKKVASDESVAFHVDKRIEVVNNRLLDESISEKRKKRLNKKLNRLTARQERKRLRHFKKGLSGEDKSVISFLGDVIGKGDRKIISAYKEGVIDSTILKAYTKEIKRYKEKHITEDLAYLARGTVRAGYDLSSLDSLNIFLSPMGDTIYFLDFDPILFDVSINPYFYFEGDSTNELSDSLSGFQLVYAKDGGSVTFDQITKLKTECKKKLLTEALERDIYEKARENAENTLESFFKLLSLQPDKKVNRVIISHSKYFEYKADYLYDGRIDEIEALEIQDLYTDDLENLDDIAFPQQSLEYQRKLLNKFMDDLYRETLNANNDVQWEKLCAKRFKIS